MRPRCAPARRPAPRIRCCCGSRCRSTCCGCAGAVVPSRSTPRRSASASATTATPRRPGALWIHAVSLGETRAAAPLVAALRAARPGLRLLLTHGTATGRAAGTELLRDGDLQAWLPWDTPGGVRRFLAHFAPAAGVLMETEVWPNLLAAAKARGVPVVLANARLSERSRRRGASGRLPCSAPRSKAWPPSWRRPRPMRRACATRAPRASACSATSSSTSRRSRRCSNAGARGRRRWARRSVVLAAVRARARRRACSSAWRGVAAPRPLLVVVPRHPQRFDGSPRWSRGRLHACRGAAPGRRAARGGGPGRRLARRLAGRDAGLLRAGRRRPCSAAASRRWAART